MRRSIVRRSIDTNSTPIRHVVWTLGGFWRLGDTKLYDTAPASVGKPLAFPRRNPSSTPRTSRIARIHRCSSPTSAATNRRIHLIGLARRGLRVSQRQLACSHHGRLGCDLRLPNGAARRSDIRPRTTGKLLRNSPAKPPSSPAAHRARRRSWRQTVPHSGSSTCRSAVLQPHFEAFAGRRKNPMKHS